eukprot:g76867.t1
MLILSTTLIREISWSTFGQPPHIGTSTDTGNLLVIWLYQGTYPPVGPDLPVRQDITNWATALQSLGIIRIQGYPGVIAIPLESNTRTDEEAIELHIKTFLASPSTYQAWLQPRESVKSNPQQASPSRTSRNRPSPPAVQSRPAANPGGTGTTRPGMPTPGNNKSPPPKTNHARSSLVQEGKMDSHERQKIRADPHPRPPTTKETENHTEAQSDPTPPTVHPIYTCHLHTEHPADTHSCAPPSRSQPDANLQLTWRHHPAAIFSPTNPRDVYHPTTNQHPLIQLSYDQVYQIHSLAKQSTKAQSIDTALGWQTTVLASKTGKPY